MHACRSHTCIHIELAQHYGRAHDGRADSASGRGAHQTTRHQIPTRIQCAERRGRRLRQRYVHTHVRAQICSLLRGGIAERGGIRVGHRIIEINAQSVVAVPHERIVNMLATAIGEVR